METIQSNKKRNMSSNKRKANSYLSKSLYIRGLQCHKSLYMEKFHRDLKPDITAEAQARFDSGNIVGEVAKGLFPNGVLVPYIETENGVSEQLRLTGEAMNNGAKAI